MVHQFMGIRYGMAVWGYNDDLDENYLCVINYYTTLIFIGIIFWSV
jgi:hypothetical protein